MDEFGRVRVGLCSEETEQALIQTNCTNSVWSLPRTERQIIRRMIESMCRQEIYSNFFPFFGIPACTEDCIRTLTLDQNFGFLTIKDPGCLTDCGDLIQDSCLSMFFTDYIEAGGVCQGSHGDVELGWPVSQSVCSVENIYELDPYHVVEELCRPQTEQALRTDECIEQVGNLSEQGL